MFQKYDMSVLSASLSVSTDVCQGLNMVGLSLTGQLWFEFNAVALPSAILKTNVQVQMMCALPFNLYQSTMTTALIPKEVGTLF